MNANVQINDKWILYLKQDFSFKVLLVEITNNCTDCMNVFKQQVWNVNHFVILFSLAQILEFGIEPHKLTCLYSYIKCKSSYFTFSTENVYAGKLFRYLLHKLQYLQNHEFHIFKLTMKHCFLSQHVLVFNFISNFCLTYDWTLIKSYWYWYVNSKWCKSIKPINWKNYPKTLWSYWRLSLYLTRNKTWNIFISVLIDV